MLEEDSVALVSERNLAAISKYDVNFSAPGGGTLRWRLGGLYGTWPIKSLDGATTYPPSETVWANQHNPEYISETEICMFDCTGLGNESRLLIVDVNESAREARLSWEYRLGVLSSVFGDCDPLPSGNLLANYWDQNYTNSSALGPDGDEVGGIVEVVRAADGAGEDRIAWHMRIYGKRCPRDEGDCQNSDVAGWHTYSVERFYDNPLLPSPGSAMGEPRCAWDGGQLVLHFTAYNSFKQSSKAAGAFTLTETAGGAVAAQGTFAFEPFWRPTRVMGVPVTLTQPNVSREVELEVRNVRNRTTAYRFDCTRG